MTKRFQDANLRMEDFTQVVLVECPQCKKRAYARKEKEQDDALLSCPDCHFHRVDNNVRYNISLKAFCNNCAHPIVVERFMQKEAVEELHLTCPGCKHKECYRPKVTPIRISQSVNSGCTDPWFGCELWLQAPFRSEVFWANNYEHLDYMRAYISAGLRERNMREFYTLVEKLPNFIKSAKNREKLVKLIDKLKKK